MNTATKSASEQTRERLIAAARELFAQQGFQGATVREICCRAGANVAAVNYHFGSKDGLLAEALHFESLQLLRENNARAAACPEERLRLFIRDFMHLLLDECHSNSPCRIMARELADPTPALDQIVREAIAPMHDYLGKLLREIAGGKMGEAEMRRCVNSVFGQCLYYRHSYPVLQRLHPDMSYGSREIEGIAQHIAGFSLDGLKGRMRTTKMDDSQLTYFPLLPRRHRS